MNDTLRMDEDSDLFNRNIKKPVGSMTSGPCSQARRSHGDLLPHLPVRMVEGFCRDVMKPEEGLRMVLPMREEGHGHLPLMAEQCLENGTVFAVHGQDLNAVRSSHHNLSGRDQAPYWREQWFSGLDRGRLG
jgi:hypothetical protein